MERTPLDTADDNKKSSKKTAKPVHIPGAYIAPPRSETDSQVRTKREIMPFVPIKQIMYDLYDRSSHNIRSEASSEDDADTDSEDTKEQKSNKSKTTAKPAVSPKDDSREAAVPLPDVFGDLPPIDTHHVEYSQQVPSVEQFTDDEPFLPIPTPRRPIEFENLFGAAEKPAYNMPESNETNQPTTNPVPPSRPTASPPRPALNRDQYSTPPPPNRPGTGGNQPPLTPNLPPPGNIPPSNANVYPAGSPNSPHYNQEQAVFGAVPMESPAAQQNSNNRDRFARGLGGFNLAYTWLSNRKHNRRMNDLERRLQANRSEATSASSRMQQEQRQQNSEQQRQANTVSRLQRQAESPIERPMPPLQPRAEAGSQQFRQEAQGQMPPVAEEALAMEGMQQEMAAGQPAHIQQDAWRRYKVDKHGREIVGAAGHGQAYRQERQQEVRDYTGDDQTRPVNSNSQMGGGYAAVPVPTLGSTPMQYEDYARAAYPSSLPSGLTTPTLQQGPATHAAPDHQLPSHAQRSKPQTSSTVAFWVMLALIIAAFFAAALI